MLRGFGFLFRTHPWVSVGMLIAAIALAFLIWPYDQALLARIHFLHGATEVAAHKISWYFGTFGDYPTYNLPLALVIWIYGAVTKSSWWRRVAVICFLGASLAGLFDDCFRLTLGRPRPDTHLPDHLYGLNFAMSGGYQSFPSGHAAAVFGTAMALLVTEVRLGLLATVFALSVVWARMELNRHYPSDVVVGSIIGIYFGLMVGLGARVRRPRAPISTEKGS